jgi:N6-adenosine-specific RNA methylase IME4
MTYEIYMICPPWRRYANFKQSQRWMMDNLPAKTLKAMKEFYFIRDCLEIGSSHNQMVFIWVTHKFTEDCREYMKALGYTYCNYLVWQRPKWKKGTAQTVFEYLLVFYKGRLLSPVPFPEALASPFTAKVKNKDEKPADAYALIESMFPMRSKLQIFGLTTRPGWDLFRHSGKK